MIGTVKGHGENLGRGDLADHPSEALDTVSTHLSVEKIPVGRRQLLEGDAELSQGAGRVGHDTGISVVEGHA
jgi:hypothetical protein